MVGLLCSAGSGTATTAQRADHGLTQVTVNIARRQQYRPVDPEARLRGSGLWMPNTHSCSSGDQPVLVALRYGRLDEGWLALLPLAGSGE